MRKAISVAAVMLALTCSARAGYIPYGSPESPPPNTAQEEQSADGYMPNGEPESLTETVLSLLEGVLALF